jgi:hypothetical protein
MTRNERNRDTCNVSPHMDTIQGYRRDADMNGMPPGYWRLMSALLGGLVGFGIGAAEMMGLL